MSAVQDSFCPKITLSAIKIVPLKIVKPVPTHSVLNVSLVFMSLITLMAHNLAKKILALSKIADYVIKMANVLNVLTTIH